MQISKLFPVVCAVAFSVSLITARADDNAVPAAAPEQPSPPAVTSETNTAPITPPPLTENSPATITETNAPAEIVAPATTENPPATPETIITTDTVAPTPAPPAETQPSMIETNAPAATVAPVPVENPPAAPEPGIAPVQTPEPAMSEVQPAPKLEKKSKADKRKAAAELKAKKKADKKAATEAKAKAKADKKAAAKAKEAKAPKTTNARQTNAAPNVVKEPVMQPIVAPPLSISTDKQAQLNALLVKYKANAITAGQYQTERAKILADP
jgi:hypothetical protein